MSTNAHNYTTGAPSSPEFPPTPEEYTAKTAYATSKLANILFSYALSPRLKTTTINSCSPGWIPSTELSRHAPFPARWIMQTVLPYLPVARTVEQGAAVCCRLVMDEDIRGVTGKYMGKDGECIPSSEQSYDVNMQKRLWEVSCELMQLQGV
ncbi:hypothetical protein SpCBS45565_g04606 [Spizellomyces sp. 'palustris']|nr:hypothetical protein SpCBS45565_g04606 [Spizellomyces sp. 'palustris']